MRLIIETVKERQESELINSKDYGLLHNVAKEQRIRVVAARPLRMIWMN